MISYIDENERTPEREISTYLFQRSHVNEYLTLKKDLLSVSDYMDKFDDLFIKCDIQEDIRLTHAKFCNGLRYDLQHHCH